MTLWLVLTVMTSVAAVLASVPLIRRLDQRPAEFSGDAAVYRDQLREVENELAQGQIDTAQAETARVEIKRRLLTADHMDTPEMPRLSLGERNFAVICVSGIVVLGSVGLYAATGNPDLPSPASRTSEGALAASAEAAERLAAMAVPAAEGEGQAQTRANLASVDEMIRRLVARLKKNPRDTEGWHTLGWAYLNTGKFAEAAEAYEKAIELSPNSAELRSAHIEALVKSADGVVTAEAKAAIEETLKLDPKDPRGRFFRGLAKEQAGDKAAALTDWTELLGDAAPDEPWVPDLKTRIGELKSEMNDDGTQHQTKPGPTATGGVLETLRSRDTSQAPPASRAIDRGPREEDIQATEAMPPSERLAMIRSMVDGLASRLEQSPRDADGWIKLIRSRMVLGETELARQALEIGLKAFSDDPHQHDRIAGAAQQIGLIQ